MIVVVFGLTINEKIIEIRNTEPNSLVKAGHHHVAHRNSLPIPIHKILYPIF